MSAGRDVVLVGGGHAHLQVLRAAAALRAAGARVTLVAPRHFWYSGLATAVVGGSHAPEEDRIDLAELSHRHGVRWLDNRVAAVHPQERSLVLADGSVLDYELVSFNIGSEVALPDPRPTDPRLWPVKPIAGLAQLRAALCDRRDGAPLHVTVVGGGATGCEVAGNLAALGERAGLDLQVTLCHASERLLPDAPAGAARRLAANLQGRGIVLRPGCRLGFSSAGEARLNDEPVAADYLVAATGLRPPALARSLADGADDDSPGGIPVTATLQHPQHPTLFAAGDCADFLPRPLPRVGVFGVRQGPVLAANLAAALRGRALRVFRPQRRYLTILNLGDGTGLALRGRWWSHGRLMLAWKHRLDRGFLRRQRC